jgi:hypothetical protein
VAKNTMQKRKHADDIEEIVSPELMSGEVLKWGGQPDPLRLARRGLGQAGSGALFLAVALFFISMGLPAFSLNFGNAFGAPIFSVIMLVMLGVGLWGLSAPLRAAFVAAYTYYAVTNHRAMIVTTFPARSVQSFSSYQMQMIDTRVHGSGLGDIIFRRDHHISRSGYRRGGTHLKTVETGFFGIRNPRQVEALMLETFMPGR